MTLRNMSRNHFIKVVTLRAERASDAGHLRLVALSEKSSKRAKLMPDFGSERVKATTELPSIPCIKTQNILSIIEGKRNDSAFIKKAQGTRRHQGLINPKGSEGQIFIRLILGIGGLGNLGNFLSIDNLLKLVDGQILRATRKVDRRVPRRILGLVNHAPHRLTDFPFHGRQGNVGTLGIENAQGFGSRSKRPQLTLTEGDHKLSRDRKRISRIIEEQDDARHFLLTFGRENTDTFETQAHGERAWDSLSVLGETL